MPKAKAYYCSWKNCNVTGVVAWGCDYCNTEDNTCRHTQELCVAAEGLVARAQSSPKLEPVVRNSLGVQIWPPDLKNQALFSSDMPRAPRD